MSKRQQALFLAAVLVLPLSCKSEESAEAGRGEANLPCTCGEGSTDFEGCANALCIAGKQNPDNPNCVCGEISLGK